jgi:mannose-6-phosphate isomerase-like protein (cupin superfamily)
MTWTKTLPAEFVRAPDGSDVRPLLELTRGGMAHCTLPPGGVSLAVRHKTIEELWYVLAEAVRVADHWPTGSAA